MLGIGFGLGGVKRASAADVAAEGLGHACLSRVRVRDRVRDRIRVRVRVRG